MQELQPDGVWHGCEDSGKVVDQVLRRTADEDDIAAGRFRDDPRRTLREIDLEPVVDRCKFAFDQAAELFAPGDVPSERSGPQFTHSRFTGSRREDGTRPVSDRKRQFRRYFGASRIAPSSRIAAPFT
jgi:hypothetical protein